MSIYTQGETIRAAELRDRCFPLVGLVTADQTVNNTATPVPVAGLDVALEGRTYYVIDGYIAYSSSTTADVLFVVKAEFSREFADQGDWSMFGVDHNSTSPGSWNGVYRTRFDGTETLGGTGSAGAQNIIRPTGWAHTGESPGAFQFWFAQVTATASNTTIKAGSWIRFTKVGTS